MNKASQQWNIHVPPFRGTPETTRRIMRTQLAALTIPAVFAVWWFGFSALQLIFIASFSGWLTQIIANRIRHDVSPGSTAHSVMIGMLVAFTLPAQSKWYIAMIGAVMAVLVGKVVFGGLGHYLWHPVLIGQVTVRLFFHEQLAMANNGLATEVPLGALRQFDNLQFSDSLPQLGQYLLEHLPPLEQCMRGNVAGSLGETSGIVLILVGLYFIYRGYVHWQLPLVFIVCAYLTACVCPITAIEQTQSQNIGHVIWLPIFAQSIDVGFTYVNYHLFTGGLLLGAFILGADMTARPITLRGQVLFAAGAGVLTIIFRLYTPIPIPCYGALLAVSTFIPTIDRLTRPRWRGY